MANDDRVKMTAVQLLLIPLGLYVLGLFYYGRFVGSYDLSAAVLLAAGSFVCPTLGISTLLAVLPLGILIANNPAFAFSGAQLFVALGLLGAIARLVLARRRTSDNGGLVWALGALLLLTATPLSRFVMLARSHFADLIGILWLHLYYGDQLSPFAFIARGWVYLLGVLMFFTVRMLQSPQYSVAGAVLRQDDRKGTARGWAGLLTCLNGKIQGESWLHGGLLGGCLVMAAYSLYDLLLGRKPWVSYFAVFDDRNTYGAFWMIGLGLLTYFWARSGSRWGRLPALAAAALFGLLLLASFSLSGIASGLLIVVLYGIAFRRKTSQLPSGRFSLRRAAGVTAVVLVATYFALPTLAVVYPPSDPISVARGLNERLESVGPARLAGTVLEGRVAFWKAGWRMFASSPLFGVGLGRYYLESGHYLSLPGGIAAYRNENAHNYFLQVAAETGVLGVILSGVFLAWLLGGRWDISGRSRNTAAGIAVVAILANSVTSHPLLVDSMLYLFGALAGLVAGPLAQPGQRMQVPEIEPARVGTGSGEKRAGEGSGRLAVFSRVLRQKKIALAGTVVFVALYALHIRSIWNRLPPGFEWGFYGTEEDAVGPFRWTRGLALKSIRRDRMPPLSVRALNPDIGRSPVTVRIYSDRDPFYTIELRDSAWHEVRMPSSSEVPPEFLLAIKPSRTWSPALMRIALDYRELGVMARF